MKINYYFFLFLNYYIIVVESFVLKYRRGSIALLLFLILFRIFVLSFITRIDTFLY